MKLTQFRPKFEQECKKTNVTCATSKKKKKKKKKKKRKNKNETYPI